MEQAPLSEHLVAALLPFKTIPYALFGIRQRNYHVIFFNQSSLNPMKENLIPEQNYPV